MVQQSIFTIYPSGNEVCQKCRQPFLECEKQFLVSGADPVWQGVEHDDCDSPSQLIATETVREGFL